MRQAFREFNVISKTESLDGFRYLIESPVTNRSTQKSNVDRALVLQHDLTFGVDVARPESSKACSSAFCHALRKASERATPMLNCVEALVEALGLLEADD